MTKFKDENTSRTDNYCKREGKSVKSNCWLDKTRRTPLLALLVYRARTSKPTDRVKAQYTGIGDLSQPPRFRESKLQYTGCSHRLRFSADRSGRRTTFSLLERSGEVRCLDSVKLCACTGNSCELLAKCPQRIKRVSLRLE